LRDTSRRVDSSAVNLSRVVEGHGQRMIDDPAFGAIVRDYMAQKVYARLNEPEAPLPGF
jgi:hypothetical protein